jgi:hypothetical protein
MECERCGRERYVNEVHLPHWPDATLGNIVARSAPDEDDD